MEKRQENQEYEGGPQLLPPQGPSYVDRGPEIVASTLAPQLGSAAQVLMRGEIDYGILSNIEEIDIILLIYCDLKERKQPSWGKIRDGYLRYRISIGGRGRKDLISMAGVTRGGLPEPVETRKPSLLERLGLKKRSEEERF